MKSIAEVISHFASAAVSSVPVNQGDFSLNIIRGVYGQANCFSMTCACAIACAILNIDGCQVGLTDFHVGLLDDTGKFRIMSKHEEKMGWALRSPVKASLFQLIASLPI